MRRSRRVDKDPVMSEARMPHRAFWLARIRIDVEMRKVAARDVETQPVASAEQVAGREQLDRDRIDLTWHHRRRPLPAVPIAAAQDALGQVHCKAARVIFVWRMHI